jgi:hypothetical protein
MTVKAKVNEDELVRVAVFSLEQAARRIKKLACEAQSAGIDAHLRELARSIDRQARELKTHGKKIAAG